MGEVLQNEEDRQLTRKLRSAAAAEGVLAPDAFEIADVIAGGPVGDTRMGRASKYAACAAGVELIEMLKGGPRSKMAKVAKKAKVGPTSA